MAKTQKKLVVTLDSDLCQGHAVCVGEAPEVFRIGADGKVELIPGEIAEQHYEAVRAAQEYCPTRTIRVSEV